MAAPPIDADTASWHIPPENQSGDISPIVRYRVRVRFKADAMWVARPTETREKQLIDTLRETCQQMDIKPVPKLIIYHSKMPNAASYSGQIILFSTDLLETMKPNQVKAVMGHELTHHKHHKWDVVKDLTLDLGLIIGYTTLRGYLKETFVKFASSRPLRYSVDVAAFIGLKVIDLWKSRIREYRSDKGGAEVAGPDSMIGALNSLNKRSAAIYQEEEKQGKNHYWKKHMPGFLKTHPSHQDRITRIREEAPQTLSKHMNSPGTGASASAAR